MGLIILIGCITNNINRMQSRAKVKGKGRKKWVAFGAVTVVQDGRDWMNGAKNVRTWACGHVAPRGERKRSITPGNARTFANPTCGRRRREAINININSGFVQYYYYYYHY